jgi:hypothetical protein
MPRFSITSTVAVSSIIWSQAIGESVDCKSTTIPLDKIWAYEMPGTRNILDLDGASKERPGDGLLRSINESDFRRAAQMKFKGAARPGFAVSGSERAALRAAHAVFVDGAKLRTAFSPDEEITIVFFSVPMSRYRVRIQEVRRKLNEIEIQYQLEPSIDGRNFENFSLIPLGKMPAGKYHVEMVQVPRELKPVESKLGLKALDKDWSRNFLCKPFSFTVAENRE